MAVDITEADGTLEISEPRRLFQAAVKNSSVAHQYRMTADGQKFIAVVPIEPHPAQPLITVVMNWAGALRQPVD